MVSRHFTVKRDQSTSRRQGLQKRQPRLPRSITLHTLPFTEPTVGTVQLRYHHVSTTVPRKITKNYVFSILRCNTSYRYGEKINSKKTTLTSRPPRTLTETTEKICVGHGFSLFFSVASVRPKKLNVNGPNVLRAEQYLVY